MMVYNVTVEQIRSWPVDKNGWHVDPATKTYIKLGDGASIGNWARIGNRASIGDGASIGNWASIGDEASIGNRARIGNGALIGNWARIGNRASIGNWALIGNWARIGDEASIIQTPIYIQGRRYWIGYCGKPGWIRSGCIEKPIEWWLENVERCAEENDYTPDEQEEYRLHVEHVAAWMKLYKVAEKGDSN